MAGSTDIGHVQPVAREHLVPVEVTPLMKTTGDSLTRLSIDMGDGEMQNAIITSLFLDGRVVIQMDDSGDEYIVDLTEYEYQWRA